MAKSGHKTRATAIDNVSQECCAKQRGDKVCTMLGAPKTLELPGMSAPMRWGSPSQTSFSKCRNRWVRPRAWPRTDCHTRLGRRLSASHPLVTKHMRNSSLYKQVSCKLMYPCARLLCVLVRKTTKTNLGETFSMSACTYLMGEKTVTALWPLQQATLQKKKRLSCRGKLPHT